MDTTKNEPAFAYATDIPVPAPVPDSVLKWEKKAVMSSFLRNIVTAGSICAHQLSGLRTDETPLHQCLQLATGPIIIACIAETTLRKNWSKAMNPVTVAHSAALLTLLAAETQPLPTISVIFSGIAIAATGANIVDKIGAHLARRYPRQTP